jgi:hypothetical protein
VRISSALPKKITNDLLNGEERLNQNMKIAARVATSTRYAFRGTLDRGIFQSSPKSSNLGHFDQTVPNSYIIWGILVKVPLIRRILGHFNEVPQKIATFGAF